MSLARIGEARPQATGLLGAGSPLKRQRHSSAPLEVFVNRPLLSTQSAARGMLRSSFKQPWLPRSWKIPGVRLSAPRCLGGTSRMYRRKPVVQARAGAINELETPPEEPKQRTVSEMRVLPTSQQPAPPPSPVDWCSGFCEAVELSLRQVYSWTCWEEHRSTTRYWRYLVTMKTSRIVRGLLGPTLWVCFAASGELCLGLYVFCRGCLPWGSHVLLVEIQCYTPWLRVIIGMQLLEHTRPLVNRIFSHSPFHISRCELGSLLTTFVADHAESVPRTCDPVCTGDLQALRGHQLRSLSLDGISDRCELCSLHAGTGPLEMCDHENQGNHAPGAVARHVQLVPYPRGTCPLIIFNSAAGLRLLFGTQQRSP